MPKFQRRSMTPEGNTNKLLFLLSNETLFFFFKSRKKWPPRNNQVERGQKGRCAPTVCGLHSISILFLFFLLLPKKRTFQFFCPFSSFFRCSSSRDSRSLLFVHRQHLPAQIKTFAAVGLGGRGGESGGGAPPLHRTSGPSAHSTLLEHFSSKKKKMSYYEEHSLSHVYILWRNQHWWKLQRRDNRPSQLAAAASVAIAVIRRFSTFFLFFIPFKSKEENRRLRPNFPIDWIPSLIRRRSLWIFFSSWNPSSCVAIVGCISHFECRLVWQRTTICYCTDPFRKL